MSYLKQEFMNHLHNNNYANPGVYCNALDNVEKFFGVSIDEEYDKDQCEALYNIIQETRKNPEQIGKNEHDVRTYASRLKKYVEFRQKQDKGNNNFTWIPFYEEFADKLLPYKVDRLSLISLIKKVYSDLGMKLPKLDYDEPVDIDPFTVFGLFNKGITDANRIKIIKDFKKLLNISADVPTDFSGIPVVNNLSATFYYFVGDREEHDIDNLWELFESALQYTETNSEEDKKKVITAYNKVIKQHGASWNITMGLYWIRPSCYVSLDSRSRDYLPEFNPPVGESVCPKTLPDGEDYFTIINLLKDTFDHEQTMAKSFYELSYNAFAKADNKPKDSKVHYWIYSPGEKAFNWSRDVKTGTMAVGWDYLGDLRQYKAKSEIVSAFRKYNQDNKSHKNDATATWQFVNDLKVGDIVFAKRGVSTIIGMGTVIGDYVYDEKYDTYKSIRRVDWTKVGEWSHPGEALIKTLTDITKNENYVQKLLEILEEDGTLDKDWWPSLEEFNPNLSKDDWKKYILEIEKPNHPVPMSMLKAMLELGGEASCKELATKYGGTTSAYIGCAVNLGKRVKKHFDLSACMDGVQERYFPFPFFGKSGDKNYVYKMRPELMEALKEIDLSDISPYYREGETQVQYWFLNANPKIWSFSSLAVGEEQDYTLYNDNGNKRRVFQNFLDAKEGDIVIGYESTPVKQIVALAKISAEQDGEKLYFEKTENLSNSIDYAVLKETPQLQNMEYLVSPQGSLFKLTEDEFECIMDLIREENPVAKAHGLESYSKEKFLSEVYMTEQRYDTLVHLLDNKKNVILQGAPGVGKTFAAKRLAYSIMGEKDDSRIEFVQFHQNYSYEDFIMGYKPADDGFELKNGIFYRFCQKAASYPEKEFFFIIDEINRGNISKILGELMMLIEKDYRGTSAILAYNGLPFSVPKNLYIIGMMNTADRSLAMIDYALRRRFSFIEMTPGFDSEGFKKYQADINSTAFNNLIGRIKALNSDIENDASLGKGFCIGHSYFCNLDGNCENSVLKEIVEYDIVPMLEEYWFDDKAKADRWSDDLRGVLNG